MPNSLIQLIMTILSLMGVSPDQATGQEPAAPLVVMEDGTEIDEAGWTSQGECIATAPCDQATRLTTTTVDWLAMAPEDSTDENAETPVPTFFIGEAEIVSTTQPYQEGSDAD